MNNHKQLQSHVPIIEDFRSQIISRRPKKTAPLEIKGAVSEILYSAQEQSCALWN
jgi:hypothetical protein